MKILLTILIFILAGFAIIGLIHGSLFIVLTEFTAVKHDAQVSLVIPFVPVSSSLCFMTDFRLIK